MPGTTRRDPHSGPVPESAWAADAEARGRGRVEVFNATRPGGLDGWTMDAAQYEVMRAHVLDTVDDLAGPDGSVLLRDVVAAAQERYATHPLFPGGRLRNYCTYTKVDLEARCLIERVPGSSPQRIRRWTGDRARRRGASRAAQPDRPSGQAGTETPTPPRVSAP